LRGGEPAAGGAVRHARRRSGGRATWPPIFADTAREYAALYVTLVIRPQFEWASPQFFLRRGDINAFDFWFRQPVVGIMLDSERSFT